MISVVVTIIVEILWDNNQPCILLISSHCTAFRLGSSIKIKTADQGKSASSDQVKLTSAFNAATKLNLVAENLSASKRVKGRF